MLWVRVISRSAVIQQRCVIDFGQRFLYPLFFFYWGFITVLAINTEGKWLEKFCSDEYIEYKKNVKRCIPWKR